jgi:hypothetical protein
MVQSRQRPGLTLESRETFSVLSEDVREDLDGDVALQADIGRSVDLAHTADAD